MKRNITHLIFFVLLAFFSALYVFNIKPQTVGGWKSGIEMLSDLIVGISAIVVAFTAASGINAWKRQTKGQAEHELARRYLRSVYKVRDSIRSVRNPLISAGEMEDAFKKQGLSPEEIEENIKDNSKMHWAVYANRWQKVSDALVDLDVELREAEVIWGKEAVNVEKEFDGLIRKFRGELLSFLNGRERKIDTDRIIYYSGQGDAFGEEIGKTIKPIETYLNQFLKL